MSKTAAELLRELDATTAWPKYPYNGTLRAAAEADRVMKALPLLAAVLDAADAMKEWVPRAADYTGRGKSVLAYDAARDALAEALKEGR